MKRVAVFVISVLVGGGIGFGIGRATDCHNRPIMHRQRIARDVVVYSVAGYRCQ